VLQIVKGVRPYDWMHADPGRLFETAYVWKRCPALLSRSIKPMEKKTKMSQLKADIYTHDDLRLA
jgi:hypothetical protein